MQKIECKLSQDFGGSIRKYFNFGEMRIMIVEHYEDKENWHKHEFTSQIIFVISGIIDVMSKNEREIVIGNEFIVIPAGEWHIVKPQTKETKLLVIKYISNNDDFIDKIKNDYIPMVES